jgi:imidazoleglycerol-phosphate dehydratase
MAARTATVNRDTLETQIRAFVNLDGVGDAKFATGVHFLEHMLDQIARHGMIDLDIKANGDLHIDAHHTVEDIGITLGQAFKQALGDKQGIRRYGHAYVPLDEALSRVVLDCSGRPDLEYHVEYPRAIISNFDVDLFREFSSITLRLPCISTICVAATPTISSKPCSRLSAAPCAWP